MLMVSLMGTGLFTASAQAAGWISLNHVFNNIQFVPLPAIPAGGGPTEAESSPFHPGRAHRKGGERPRQEKFPRLEEMREKRAELRAELEALPPEERKARMEELREYYSDSRDERRAAFREEFQKRWDSASDEERAIFCDKAHERCRDGGARACDFVSKTCGPE